MEIQAFVTDDPRQGGERKAFVYESSGQVEIVIGKQ
jgi:hypothetical protein